MSVKLPFLPILHQNALVKHQYAPLIFGTTFIEKLHLSLCNGGQMIAFPVSKNFKIFCNAPVSPCYALICITNKTFCIPSFFGGITGGNAKGFISVLQEVTGAL